MGPELMESLETPATATSTGPEIEDPTEYLIYNATMRLYR